METKKRSVIPDYFQPKDRFGRFRFPSALKEVPTYTATKTTLLERAPLWCVPQHPAGGDMSTNSARNDFRGAAVRLDDLDLPRIG